MNENTSYDKGDTLPEDYRLALIELMSFQADSEYAGAQRVAENQRFVPRPEEAYRLSKKIYEEIGHAYAMWMLLQELGVDVNERVSELAGNSDNPDPSLVSVIPLFHKNNWTRHFDCWEDVALYSLVCNPATVIYLSQFQNCSYLPWARASVRIHKEEHGHLAFGIWAATRCIAYDGERTREFMQERIGRFIRLGLDIFGRPASGPGRSRSFDTYREFRLKMRRPEELQTDYLDLVSSRLKTCGFEMPDDYLLPPSDILRASAVATHSQHSA